jgi:glycerol-3-phosphate O-acyltransferase/dihydroxyacetone phosphate acyltransferase
MNEDRTGLYRLMRRLIGLATGFYFRRIDCFHAQRVPLWGPILFTSNHPNSLTDSFVIGASVPRKVNFIATVQLFRFAPLKWFLSNCGVIPINRAADNPKAMRSVADTFEACFKVLERGEAVGIFPEGVTYDDSRLREVKSGAARMALELEHRHGGKLGLKILPVGLTYSAKELYRTDVLVNFGEPILVAEFLATYEAHRKDSIAKLRAEIESRIQSLILHIPELEHTRVVEAVKRLYLDRLLVGSRISHEPLSPRAEELTITQRIVEVVGHVYRTQPERAKAFAAKLDFYERWMKRLRLSDEDLVLFPKREKLAAQSLGWAAVAILGAPIALYGWIHRIIPHELLRWAVIHFTHPEKRKAQTSTTKIAGGIVAYGLCFGIYILMFQVIFGWPASFWYAISLPLATLLAFYHLREVRKLKASVRNSIVLLRAPFAARRLLRLRAALVHEIEAVHVEMRSQGRSTII